MEENKKGNNYTKVILFIIFAIVITGLVGYDIYLNINKKIIQTTNITKTEKEVTITDEGIAEAVDKLYDSTVIVELMNGSSVYGWGSGFIYKVDGKTAYIVTNYHVTEDNKTARIEFTDYTTADGEVIGGDPYTDISVIKIETDKELQVAALGESHKTKLGDTVFAVGTPISMNFKFSVTRGILSGKDRLMSMSNSKSSNYSRQSVTSESWYINLLQIDASINSGNSGGPLANSNGEVIGVTNSKLASSEIENIGFAIPIEDVKNIADQVINQGEVVRPYLGVSLTTVEAAKMNDMIPSDYSGTGAVVGAVESGSTFDKAGIKTGDIVVKIGDFETKDYKYLKYYLYRYKVGDKVSVTYVRDGKEHTTEITLEKKK